MTELALCKLHVTHSFQLSLLRISNLQELRRELEMAGIVIDPQGQSMEIDPVKMCEAYR